MSVVLYTTMGERERKKNVLKKPTERHRERERVRKMRKIAKTSNVH